MEGKKVNDELTVTGQVTPEDLRQAAQQGFKSVLNLRASDEKDFLADEAEQARAAGLEYANIAVRKEEISPELTTRVLETIDALPKPALIHCASGMRAGAMAFMHAATRNGLSAAEAMEQAQQSGFDCSSEPQLKQFFEQYVDSHTQR